MSDYHSRIMNLPPGQAADKARDDGDRTAASLAGSGPGGMQAKIARYAVLGIDTLIEAVEQNVPLEAVDHINARTSDQELEANIRHERLIAAKRYRDLLAEREELVRFQSVFVDALAEPGEDNAKETHHG